MQHDFDLTPSYPEPNIFKESNGTVKGPLGSFLFCFVVGKLLDEQAKSLDPKKQLYYVAILQVKTHCNR